MAILKVARMGHPVLSSPTKPMSDEEILDKKTQLLVDNMVETMREYHGVGLAAPQVHESKRLFIAEVTGDGSSRDSIVPLTVLFNFEIVDHSESMDHEWEGCLSIPEIRGLVPRYESITVKAKDRHAKEMSFEASGFFARVLQHEGDHLDGIMFPERMDDLSQLAFTEEFSRFHMG